MKIYSHGCTLDCWDSCKFNVYVEDGKILKIEGDKSHPYTKGIICVKGRKHLERLYHSERIYSPLLKINGKWIEITFDEAIKIVCHRLLLLKREYGSSSVMHFYQSGSNGILKSIEDVFFNYYGGVTLADGSPCWGAGIKAQKYDFGDAKGHFLVDMMNSKCIFLWGRNPSNTSIHLMQMINEAKKRNIKVVVIDPICTDTAKKADKYVSINPSTDGALAMAMTKVLIEEEMIDQDYINNYTYGYEYYKDYLDTLDLQYLSSQTGLKIEEIRELARLYGDNKPATIYPGYGLQKYKNGGNTIRAIDAMAAIVGYIGIAGGGVNYANRVYPGILNLDPYNSRRYAKNERYFNLHNFSNFIKNEDTPPIKAIFITKSNPIAQLPNINRLKNAFKEIEFKVCIDMFMTDTASCCDLFIPCTNTLESEDIVYSSMNNSYITYNEQIVEPNNKLMDEYFFFMELAKHMNISDYPYVSKQEYLNKVIQPLRNYDIDLNRIKNDYIAIDQNGVAWIDKEFSTPSKKIEIYSEKAKTDGLSPIPVYISSLNNYEDDNKVRLITGHPRNSLFSQHFLDVQGIAIAYISSNFAKKLQLCENDKALLKNSNGEIEVLINISGDVPDNIVYMHTGWWEKHGNPNSLTVSYSSEMGGQLAYYETLIDIVKSASE